ncbi:MAG: hypothetical protein C4547_01400 [Phycisphaerales bacterium]|nr:MAG: hypothetical protein C4547_01400 [Phycisphaerales bacterium]
MSKAETPRGLKPAARRSRFIAHADWSRPIPRAGAFLTALALALALTLSAALTLAADPPKPQPKPPEKPAARSDQAGDEDADQKEKDKDEEKEEPDRYLAIQAGVVHTVTGPDLRGVTLLCKNGKIASIGTDLDVPDEAELLDASGFHVYPGLVAAGSSGVVGREPVEDNTDVYGLNVTLALAGGMTTVLAGNTVAKVTYGTLEDHVIRTDAFVNVSYGTGSPDARRRLRDSLDKLRQHLRDVETYEREKKLNPQAKAPDDKWIRGPAQQHLKLLKHEAVAIASASRAQDILDLCELARQYGIDLVVRGAWEGWTVAPQLGRAGVSAIVTPRDRVTRDERYNRPNGSSIENAAILHAHGVPLAIVPSNTAITTWGVAGRDLLHLAMEAAFGIRGGLPQDAALRAVTIDAARILGVDHRVGSIEVGKDADFAVTDGDILHYMTLVRWTVVNGRIAYDKEKDSLYQHIRPDEDRDRPAPTDYWPRRLGAE